ncbi:PucR family transcriptional regulator [Streptomyces cylindrosporus]|uniref:Helix-turn-helix domain-containing protein n=1 Tax=Streptomyces cylindrosporus TaxID=2927583 RepID=A0ABS9Y8B8_9ACTN|nr:helix-turn-helix domain-containing protein [Streptomyces cylindrosporus]MCI3273472.1 helix-turn-helix domain-containing protein [Streptomyces cylindrosporus]
MDIDTTVEHLAALLERPLVLYDVDLNVAAYSAHDADVDEARRLTILSRRGSATVRDMLRASGAAHTASPVRLPAADGVPERIAVGVRHDGRLMGYLVWVEPGAPRDVPATVRELLDRFGPDLGRLLAVRALDSQETRLRLRMLVSDLVSDDAARRAEAARALVDDGALPDAAEYTGFVIAAPDAGGSSAAQRRTALESALAGLARSMREAVAGAVIGDRAVAVLAHGASRSRTPVRPPAREGVLVGMGAPVHELSDTVSSVRQARLAVRGGELDPVRYGPVVSWDDLGLDRLLLRLPLERLTVEDLPASVARLVDPASGPDLATTLEAYLDCGADGQETAKRLMIHRSTLYYRLDRARKVTGADLRDGAARRELHTGLRVARLAGILPLFPSTGG